MKAYVAGSSREIDRARRVIAALRKAGYEITADWPAIIDAHQGRANEGLTDDERFEAARATTEAAAACDVFLLLVPAVPTIGAWWEGGVAHAAGAIMACSGIAYDVERTIFTALCSPVFTFDTNENDALRTAQQQALADDEAIDWLTRNMPEITGSDDEEEVTLESWADKFGISVEDAGDALAQLLTGGGEDGEEPN